MKDHLEKFITRKDKDYFDKFFIEDVDSTNQELIEDDFNPINTTRKREVSKSVINKKTQNLRDLSDLISQVSEDIYMELEKLIDDMENSSLESDHHHADTLLEMSKFTEDMLIASKSIKTIKEKI